MRKFNYHKKQDTQNSKDNSKKTISKKSSNSFRIVKDTILNDILIDHQLLDLEQKIHNSVVKASTLYEELNFTASNLQSFKNQLNSLNEMGEMEYLRLQIAMDRMSKLMSTLSNLLKKTSETANNIVQNIKFLN